MEYRQLGKSGVRLSVIGLGSYLTIGMTLDDDAAEATIRAAYDCGINFFDTANAYNNGRAEEALGKFLPAFRRDSIVLATKVFAPMGDGPNDRGLSAKHIREQCEASLKRLGMDYVDLYQCHRPDAAVPLEETVRAMDDLARAGKILYWGTSEWPAWMISEAIHIAREIGARPPVSNQPRYSLLYRLPESEVFQQARACGIGQVVFSPLAHGILTGKYTPGEPPPEGTRAADDRQNMVIKNLYWQDEYLRNVQEMKKIAGELGITCAQLALAWILHHPEVTSCIIGASRTSQIEDNCGAAEVAIPKDVLGRLDKLFPGPGEAYTA